MAKEPALTAAPESGGSFFDGLTNLGVLRQIGLMIGLAASVAVGVSVVMWSQSEDYQPLSANLEQIDPQDVIAVLNSNEIKYKVDQRSGALLVAADQIHQARLKLAGEGINIDGSFGFELLDKEQPLGTSQFMENARFRRSLEGELARTISNIRSVRSARVHLAIPKPSAFIRDPRKPTASVLLDLYSGAGISQEQVRAIANLVASSISELTIENVTVVDQKGNLLSNFEQDEDMLIANRQLEYTRQIENSLTKRIGSILEPMLGRENYRAEVSADVDFTEVEQTDELFNPEMPAIRSEQTLEEGRASGSASGVPGALSNQPPADARAPEVAGAGSAGAAAGASSRRQATRNYELDRTISYTRHQIGRVRRLSVAVVVDNRIEVDEASGERRSVALSAQEIEQLVSVVKNAVGFDAARGDSVDIINSPFMSPEVAKPEPIEELPLWQRPEFYGYAKQLAGVLFVMVLIFGVLRPVMKSLSQTSRELREMEAQRALGDLGTDLADETVTLSGGDAILLPGHNQSYDQQVTAIKGLVAEDPGRVAQVVKKWVAASD